MKPDRQRKTDTMFSQLCVESKIVKLIEAEQNGDYQGLAWGWGGDGEVMVEGNTVSVMQEK